MVGADGADYRDMFIIDFFMRTRCRIIVFFLSAAAFTLLCLFILLRPSPSTLITVPATNHIQKVSVILCTPHASTQQVVSTYTLLKNALSSNNLQYEFFVVSMHLKSSSYSTRPTDSYHILSFTHSCAESAYYALEHSHYSVLLYLSSNLTSYESTIPKLVNPVLQGDSDLVLLKDINNKMSHSLWQRLLYLLLVPITGTTHVSDTPSFAISSAVWFHGCHGINSGRGSLTVDLVSRCEVTDWREIECQTMPPREESSLLLSQVIILWWDCHPFIFLLLLLLLFVTAFFIKVKLYKKNTNNNFIEL